MTPLISLKNISCSFSALPLLDRVSFEIFVKERIALIGRNGEGKSTLLKILAKKIMPDEGEIVQPRLRDVAILSQDLPAPDDRTVFEVVAEGLENLSDLLVEYHQLTHQTADHNQQWLDRLNEVQKQIEIKDGWQFQQKIEKIIDEFKLPQDEQMKNLSGGWRRKVALAQVFVQEPDLLILDEPTNHLDIEAILYLEQRMLNYPKTLIFITHDRMLLRKTATRIIELDRGKLTSFNTDYDQYLVLKAQLIEEEQRHNALFDKKLSEEEAWIRQGIKARRTRNEGRVRALEALREQRKLRRERKAGPKFEASEAQSSGKTVIQAIDVSFSYQDNQPIINNFNFTIQRGDKVAIVGPNGGGKSTLVKCLLGLLTPTSGKVKQTPNCQVAFFDQNRDTLNPELTVMENVAQGDDFVEINGKRKHVIGYLGDFLFSPQKCRSLVKVLSGGEQNRLLLAKLFAKPANLLVLDEPTNDLDVESLDVLENILLNYHGTVILISHDRSFIDNIATHCILIEGQGKVFINVGGFSDWLSLKPDLFSEAKNLEKKSSKSKTLKKSEKKQVLKEANSVKKLSYQQRDELKKLPVKIEKLESAIATLHQQMAAPDFFTRADADSQAIIQKVQVLEKELADAYKRWEQLED